MAAGSGDAGHTEHNAACVDEFKELGTTTLVNLDQEAQKAEANLSGFTDKDALDTTLKAVMPDGKNGWIY